MRRLTTKQLEALLDIDLMCEVLSAGRTSYMVELLEEEGVVRLGTGGAEKYSAKCQDVLLKRLAERHR